MTMGYRLMGLLLRAIVLLGMTQLVYCKVECPHNPAVGFWITHGLRDAFRTGLVLPPSLSETTKTASTKEQTDEEDTEIIKSKPLMEITKANAPVILQSMLNFICDTADGASLQQVETVKPIRVEISGKISEACQAQEDLAEQTSNFTIARDYSFSATPTAKKTWTVESLQLAEKGDDKNDKNEKAFQEICEMKRRAALIYIHTALDEQVQKTLDAVSKKSKLKMAVKKIKAARDDPLGRLLNNW